MATENADNKIVKGSALKAALAVVKAQVAAQVEAGVEEANRYCDTAVGNIDLSPLEKKVKALELSKGVMESDISDLKLKMPDVENSVAALNSDVAGLQATVTNLTNGAPETLDTLKEIADALGNDENLSATLMAEIGKKADASALDNCIVKTDLMTEAEAEAMAEALFAAE